jgi:hypothetical protein
MISQSHAASRATARTPSMVLRVSQPALHGSSVRSLSKKLACANSLATDSLSALTTGAASRMGDDLAWFIAETFFTTYVERDGPPLMHSHERNHR